MIVIHDYRGYGFHVNGHRDLIVVEAASFKRPGLSRWGEAPSMHARAQRILRWEDLAEDLPDF